MLWYVYPLGVIRVYKLPLGWEMRGNQPFIGGLIPAKLTTTIIELNQKKLKLLGLLITRNQNQNQLAN